MKLYIDNATNSLVTSTTLATAPTITLFKEDISSVEIRFVENGSVVDIGTPTIRLALGKDGGLIALTDSWTKNGTGATAYWTGSFNLNTQQAEMVLAGLSSTEAILEVEVRQGTSIATKAQISVTLKTDLINETDTATDIGNIVTIGASHIAGTTNVHGIANTANLVLTSDSRLTNSRAPTAHKSSHATGGTDALSASDIGAVVTTDTRIANIEGGSIDTRAGAVTERSWEVPTGDEENPFETQTETSQAGGSNGNIILKGGNGGFGSSGGGVGGNAGSINTSGGLGSDGRGGNGGSILLVGGVDTADAGSINLSGGNTVGNGGSIISTGANGDGYNGGTLNMSASSNGNGGSIDTSSAGGSIITSSGGGSINTSGIGTTPSIGLGASWSNGGTGRTTLIGRVGQASYYPANCEINRDKTIYLPNADGTIALESFVKDIAADYLYRYAGIDGGYVITNIKFKSGANVLTAEWNRDVTLAKNDAFTPFTKVSGGGGFVMLWNGSELQVSYGDEEFFIVQHAKLISTIREKSQQNGTTTFNTYDVWAATDYNDYLPYTGYELCEVTWIKTELKSNIPAGKLVLGNTDRTTTIQATSTAPRTISIPDATPQGGTFALWPRVPYGGILSATNIDAISNGTFPMIQGSGTGGVITILNGVISVTSAGSGYVDGVATKAGGSRFNLVTQATLPAPANLPVITTTGGNISAGSFGTTANTFCQGDDVRLGAKTIFTLGGEAKTTFALDTPYLYGGMPTRGPQLSGSYLNAVLKILGNFTVTGISIHQYLPSTTTATLTYQLVRVTGASSFDALGSSIVVAGNNNLTTATSSLSASINNGDQIGLILRLGVSGAVPSNTFATTILANLYCVPR